MLALAQRLAPAQMLALARRLAPALTLLVTAGLG
jgi:hypothetical protein